MNEHTVKPYPGYIEQRELPDPRRQEALDYANRCDDRERDVMNQLADAIEAEARKL